MNGLVIAGGRSSRMGRDKATLVFQGEALHVRAVRILRDGLGNFSEEPSTTHSLNQNPLAKQVYLSARRESSFLSDVTAPTLFDDDDTMNAGPVAALLRAHREAPNKTWFVLACDFPFAEANDIRNLIEISLKWQITSSNSSRDEFGIGESELANDAAPKEMPTQRSSRDEFREGESRLANDAAPEEMQTQQSPALVAQQDVDGAMENNHPLFESAPEIICYQHEDQTPEPLFAIWTPAALERLEVNFKAGQDQKSRGPMQTLRQSRVKFVQPLKKNLLVNTNTPLEWQRVIGDS